MNENSPFLKNTLPVLPRPTISLHIEQVKRFRNNYAMLNEFAARVCGVPVKELTPLHLFFHTPEFKQWYYDYTKDGDEG